MTIENEDQFLHLYNSYLLIEGDELKVIIVDTVDSPIMVCCNSFPV